MGRLRGLSPSRIAKLSNLVSSIGVEHRHNRKAYTPWRKWYDTPRWHDLRQQVFLRDRWTCKECGTLDLTASTLVVHHTTPHHGNPVLFWDTANLLTVCKTCHDTVIQSRERIAQQKGQH